MDVFEETRMPIHNNYKLEHVSHPHHVVTIHASWKRLPLILDCLRSIPLDIRRAHISKESSTLYLKNHCHGCDISKELTRATSMDTTSEIPRNPRMRLPLDTQILLYNIPSLNFTTMEFGCHDRIGLLCDLLLFLEPLSIDLDESYVTTVGSFAHNILHLTKNGKPLGEEEMTYIHNVFEYEAKERIDPNHTMM